MILRVVAVVATVLSAGILGCASSPFGESWTWKRPCATAAQLEADRQACVAESVGVVDPSGTGSEYGQDFFRECMESRGWQRVPSSTVLECK